MNRLRTLLRGKNPIRWKVLDQSFFSLFITFSLIELTNVGAGLIDGLVVSNFLSADSMAAAQYLSMGYLFLHFLGKDRMLRFVALSSNVKEVLHLLACGTEKAVKRLSNVILKFPVDQADAPL